MKRVLCAVGNVRDINTWSNIPYFFWRAGWDAGFLHDGLEFEPAKLRRDRVLWNAWSLATTGAYGGFQYSERFLRSLFRQATLSGEDSEIISHFPLLPLPDDFDGPVNFYIDATLNQNFKAYGIGRHIPRRVQQDALGLERENYARAQRIVCMSHWAARSVVGDYRMPPNKVHVIRPGANLSEAAIREKETVQTSDMPLEPLRLGFVGTDWRRKNLSFVLEIADRLIARGHATEVIAVGAARSALPSHPALVPAGYIDKAKDMSRFIEAISTAHFGCLFSHAEAFGISNLEFLRLGIPVLGRDVGGIADTVPDGCGHLFPADAAADDIAALLAGYVEDPTCYRALREAVASRAGDFTWSRTVDRFAALWRRDSGPRDSPRHDV